VPCRGEQHPDDVLGAAKGTVIKLLEDVGGACKRFNDSTVFLIEAKKFQCDEISSFCYAKETNIPPEAFGKEIDFGVLKKIYSKPNKGAGDTATRYSPNAAGCRSGR